MNAKEQTELLDYLKILQFVYDRRGWRDNSKAEPVSIETISQTRNFFTALTSQIPLKDIPKPDEIYPVENGDIGIDWFLISPKGEMDLFYIHVRRDGSLRYRSSFDSLGTSIDKETKISDVLDELLLIHIKHFD